MLFDILKFLGICLEVLLIFNLLIIVHEIGHFLAARWRGLHIEGFGIWFGKPIWQKKINGVVYSFGSIPFGGFVKLPQLGPMEAIEGETHSDVSALKPISSLDKIVVAIAGPLFSLLLAFVFAVIVWIVGRPVAEREATTTVGYVVEDGPAHQAGVLAGDEILAVDGRPVSRWGGQSEDGIVWNIVRSEGQTIRLTIRRDGTIRDIEVAPAIPKTEFWQRRATRQIQIAPAESPMIARVTPGSPAAEAGLKPSDVIVAINGEPALTPMAIDLFAETHPGTDLILTVERGDQTLQIPFRPRGPIVGSVTPGSPAERAGFQVGDRVVAVDGEPIPYPTLISDKIGPNPGVTFRFTLERGHKKIELAATPEIPVEPAGAKNAMLGIVWENGDGYMLDQYGRFKVIHPLPLEQVRAGMSTIVSTIAAIASPKSDVSVQHMGGPVQMMRIYYLLFESPEGWRLALWFSVILNVNLAILNMLPLPVLDGGHITLALIEAARRRPVNAQLLERISTACAMLLIGFMLFITFFDVQDLFGGKREPLRFASPPSATP